MLYEKNTQPKIQMLNRLYNVVACYIAPNSILVFCSRSCFFLRSLQVSLNAQGKFVTACPLTRECVRNLDLRGAGASWRALDLKTAGAHSTTSLKISGCKRWCPKDLRVHAPAAPVLTHSLLTLSETMFWDCSLELWHPKLSCEPLIALKRCSIWPSRAYN